MSLWYHTATMFGKFSIKAMLKRQMKGIPESQQEMFLTMIEKNPDFFMTIAKEAQHKMKSGMSQQDAMMSVIKAHETELKAIMGK